MRNTRRSAITRLALTATGLTLMHAAAVTAGAQARPPVPTTMGNMTATIATHPSLVDPVSTTAISGFRGNELTWVAFGPGTTGIDAISFSERHDKPCAFAVHGKSLLQGSASEGSERMSICGPEFHWPEEINFLNSIGDSNRQAIFDGNPRHYLRGIAVCTNGNSNHRLKGVRIYPASVGTDATVNALSSSETAEQANCSQWHPAVYCPAGQVASGVALHHTDEEFTGAALRCRRVVPTT